MWRPYRYFSFKHKLGIKLDKKKGNIHIGTETLGNRSFRNREPGNREPVPGNHTGGTREPVPGDRFPGSRVVPPVVPRYWVLGTGYWVLGTGYWVLGTGYWVLGTGYWVLGTGYWVLGKHVLKSGKNQDFLIFKSQNFLISWMSKVLEVLFLDFLWYLKYLTPFFFLSK